MITTVKPLAQLGTVIRGKFNLEPLSGKLISSSLGSLCLLSLCNFLKNLLHLKCVLVGAYMHAEQFSKKELVEIKNMHNEKKKSTENFTLECRVRTLEGK